MPYTAKIIEYSKQTSPAQTEFYLSSEEILLSSKKEKKYQNHNIKVSDVN